MKKVLFLFVMLLVLTAPVANAAEIADSGIRYSPMVRANGDWKSNFYNNWDGFVNVGTTNHENHTETVTFKIQNNSYHTWYSSKKGMASGESRNTGLVKARVGSINRGYVDTDNKMYHSPWFNA